MIRVSFSYYICNTVLACLLFLLFQTSSNAQIPDLQWASSFGGTSSSDYAWSQTIDNNGDLIVTGFFSGTVDFDPGPAIVNRTSAGDNDIFIQKLDPNGNLLWIRTIGGPGRERGQSIAVDASNNIVIAGEFEDTVDFDPGPSNFTLIGIGNVTQFYVLKLDQNGSFLWANAFYSTGNVPQCEVNSLDCDQTGSVYLTGSFRGVIDFDPGPDSAIFSNSIGGWDLFVLKLNANGGFTFAKIVAGKAATNYGATGNSIKVGNSGDVYVTGSYRGQLDFDPGVGSDSLINNELRSDAFVFKLDTSGAYQWVREFGNAMREDCYDLSIDPQGDIYVTGSYSGTLDFDPGVGFSNLTASLFDSTFHACFLLKLDESGNYIWSRSIGPTGSTGDLWANSTFGSAVANDLAGNVYLTGVFFGTSDLDPGPGSVLATSNGNVDFFIEKLSSNGVLISAASFGGYSVDIGISIDVDNSGAIYCSGIFRSQVDFDPGPGSALLTSVSGSNDYFVSKFQTCNSNSSSISIVSCGSYQSPSGIYNWDSSGVYLDTLANAGGCDSVITVSLTINSVDTVLQSEFACISYTWPVNNQTYTSTGSYFASLVSSNNCDSVIELQLLIGQSFGNDTALACGDNYTSPSGNYVWTLPGNYVDTIPASNGCDSIIFITLTLNNGSNVSQIITSCFEYFWSVDSNTYDQSGNYTVVLTNSVGCDSIVTLDLTIIDVDTSLQISMDTIFAASNAGTYQWLDCANGFSPIAGQVSQFFKPTMNGSYAVQVTNGICVDTSSCVTVNWVGLPTSYIQDQIVIWPNPATDKVLIDLQGEFRSGIIKLIDAKGSVHLQRSYSDLEKLEIGLSVRSGMYMILIHSPQGNSIRKRLIVND